MRDAERRELHRTIPGRGAEQEPPAGQLINAGGGLRRVDRVTQRQHNAGRA